MARRFDDPLDSILEEELKALERRVPASAPHVDPPLLAAFLDRQVSDPERDWVEGHLADCSECRTLATAAFHALPKSTIRRLRDWLAGFDAWTWQPALAAAALVLVVGILAGRIVPSGFKPGEQAERPSDGKGDGEPAATPPTQTVDPEIKNRQEEVREGRLPFIMTFEIPTSHEGTRGPLRGGNDDSDGARAAICGSESQRDRVSRRPTRLPAEVMPEPFSPRCEVILGGSPTFVWQPAPQLARSATAYEVILVDEADDVVATLPFSPPPTLDASSRVKMSFPADKPPLKAGQTYKWKVSPFVAGEWRPSDVYVPFRVLDPPKAAILKDELLRAGNDPYARAIVFAWNGLYGDALETLTQMPKDRASQDLARPLAMLILQRKGLPLSELDRTFEVSR